LTRPAGRSNSGPRLMLVTERGATFPTSTTPRTAHRAPRKSNPRLTS